MAQKRFKLRGVALAHGLRPAELDGKLAQTKHGYREKKAVSK